MLCRFLHSLRHARTRLGCKCVSGRWPRLDEATSLDDDHLLRHRSIILAITTSSSSSTVTDSNASTTIIIIVTILFIIFASSSIIIITAANTNCSSKRRQQQWRQQQQQHRHFDSNYFSNFLPGGPVSGSMFARAFTARDANVSKEPMHENPNPKPSSKVPKPLKP